MNGECTRATTKAKIGRRKRRGQEGKKGWRAICDGRALGNKGSTKGCSIKKIDRIAGVLQDDKTSRGKGFYQLLCAHEPKKPSPSGSVIVHVATVNQDMGNLVNMVIPGIHGNAKEKDAKCPAHVNTIMECKRGAEGGANFMEDTTSEKDMAAIRQDPKGGPSNEKNVHDPMRVDPFKSFGEIRQ